MINLRPPVSPRSGQRPPEDLDGLLRAFMRSEMPDPWPAMPVLPEPLRVARPKTDRWFHPGSRFALAATLAACLVGTLTLASSFPTEAPPAIETTTDSGHLAIKPLIDAERKPFKDRSPEGRNVKGWEMQKGKTMILKIELDDMP
jgi:hypothetical protein